VPADDLTSISGLEDKHARTLARQPLQITTFRELASADGDAIYRAMHRFQPRPQREDIARWQDEARSKFRALGTDASDWQPVASFAVVFSQRQVDGSWERRLEAGQTETEHEMPPFVESNWDCRPVCGWMLERLGQHDDGDDQARLSEKAGRTQKPRVTRERLHIESAEVIDATGPAHLVQAGKITASPSTELVSPDRVILNVTGGQPGHEVLAVARIRAHGESEWNSADPASADRSGRAELSLPPVGAGEHDIKLLAWTPDATAYLASVQLPTVTIKAR
jgi:hypothetical protein